ncbi:MAG: UDP-2,3-diacylglucosamine diphosphatase [Thaumarchaeota archaeon]|nr:UDP-2,3-diacylglucosamine diphosphatase [Nitrososphaerota archaeon]
MSKHKYRTVWISDIHLGTRGCKAKFLEDFLRSIECEHLFLVGDIIDGWAMSRGSRFFPQEHVNIIRRFLNKARNGTKVKYVIGNHDEMLRKYLDYFVHVDIGNIEIGNDFVHETADGRKLWVTHGDLYDGVTRYHKWISHLGDIGYALLISLNGIFNRIRKTFGFGYWSLSAYIKHKVKKAVEFINSFEGAVARECKQQGYNGVVCGHIHHAEIKDIDGITYYNDGDWVESCTALVEHLDGKMEIIQWAKITH